MDERATQLQSLVDPRDALSAETEKGAGVQASHPVPLENDIGLPEPVRTGNSTGPGVPEAEVQILLVESVEVSRTTSTFACSSESGLSPSSDLQEEVWDFTRARQQNAKTATVGERRLRRQSFHLALQRRSRNRARDPLPETARWRGRHRRTLIGEQLGPTLHRTDKSLVAVQLCKRVREDRPANHQFEQASTLLQELAREQGGPESRVKQSRKLKERAVAPGEEDRDDRGAGAPGEAHDRGAPRRVIDRAAAQVETRDFAGREDGE
jgi:hypothetical protein